MALTPNVEIMSVTVGPINTIFAMVRKGCHEHLESWLTGDRLIKADGAMTYERGPAGP
jgi:hypothetical protein